MKRNPTFCLRLFDLDIFSWFKIFSRDFDFYCPLLQIHSNELKRLENKNGTASKIKR